MPRLRVCLACLALAVGLFAVPSPVQSQDISITPYLGGGPASNGFSTAAGLRVEIVREWGAYVRGAFRGVTNVCEDSLPPHCNYPEGDTREFAAGVLRSFGSAGQWVGRWGVGGGFVSWQDARDPFVEATGEARRRLSGRLALVFGLHGLVAPGVEREGRGDRPIVSETTVVFPNVSVGISIPLR